MCARALAADLALAMLQPTQARVYLDGPLPPSEPAEPIEDDVLLNYYALRAETALETGDERGAVEELVRVLEISPENPRLLAIQARIIHHREDPQSAADVLESVLKSMGDPSQAEVSLIRAAAQAAIDQSQWEVAISLFERAIEQAGSEPRSHMDLARTLVLRAEFSSLCQALDAIRRADEPQARSEAAQQALDLALTKAEELVRNWDGQMENRSISRWADPTAQIQHWRARGTAIFQPSAEAARALAALPPNADDAAARVACLREVGDLVAAGLAARDYPQHPLVLLQLALALLHEKPRQAMAAIHAAVDVLNDPAASRRNRSAFCAREISPLAYSLMARLFHINGNRAGDRESALQAIQNALNLWDDEPHWHVLAAEIYLGGETVEEQSDLDAAINHLEQATRLEPSNTESLLVLGQIYLRQGAAQKAAQSFEQAVQAEPEEPEPSLWLARAQRSLGDLEGAAANAERAVTLAPNQVQPLLLRGEIALQANNPRGAQSRAQAALRIQPDDPEVLLLLARALNALDRPEEALATLEKALPLASESLPLSVERVRLLQRAHGFDAAIQAAQTLADHNPEEPRVLALQAELLEGAGQGEAAIRAAQRALRLPDRLTGTANGLPNPEQAKLHYLLGRMLSRSGQLDQAVHHLTETIRLAPEMVEAYLEIGHVHQERRQHNQALNAYRQAITVAPHDHRPYYLIGLALKESKDYLGAEKMLRRAADLAPNDVSIHRLLGAVVALNLVHNRREPTSQAGRFS
jgi:tetratricopeptide (TPR) repeat protein